MSMKAQVTTFANRAQDAASNPFGLKHFLQDREIFHQGDDAGVFFTVMSGMVRTCRFYGDGRRQIDAFHGPGDVFGFDSAQEQSLSAEAVSDCTVAPQRWRGSIANHDGVPKHLFSQAMCSLARSQAHASLLGRRSPVEKVAAFLLERGGQPSEPVVVTLEMTRIDIADYLGLTMETVSRTLWQFVRASLIELTTAREVCLHNTAVLRELRG